jgi:predicted ATP-dependent protease
VSYKYIATKGDINSMPKADVVEREKVNKAIEEIEYLRAQYRNDTYYDCKHEVLEILKRNIGE